MENHNERVREDDVKEWKLKRHLKCYQLSLSSTLWQTRFELARKRIK